MTEVEPGTFVRLGSYGFVATLHGPMRWGTCVDCDRPALEVQPTGRIGHGGMPEDTGDGAATRCDGCGRAYHGASLTYYGAGLRPAPVLLDRHRLRVTQEAFAWSALHSNDPRVQCTWCLYPIDPAAGTVEHPDRHPACVSYPADAPMETPLEDS